jgi:hypothetical protein
MLALIGVLLNAAATRHAASPPREIGILLPNNQRQHRTLHIQKDVLPCALRQLLCPVSVALANLFRMDSISPSHRGTSFIRKTLPHMITIGPEE